MIDHTHTRLNLFLTLACTVFFATATLTTITVLATPPPDSNDKDIIKEVKPLEKTKLDLLQSQLKNLILKPEYLVQEPIMEVDWFVGRKVKMRHEQIYLIKDGVKLVIQDRIYKDATNELREEWILDSNDKKINIHPQDGSVFVEEENKNYPNNSEKAEKAKKLASELYYYAKSLLNRKAVQDSDCKYHDDKNRDGKTTAMRLVEVDESVCGSAKVTLCVGAVECVRKGDKKPFNLMVACKAIDHKECPEPKNCALSESIKISPPYSHKPKNLGSNASSDGSAIPAK